MSSVSLKMARAHQDSATFTRVKNAGLLYSVKTAEYTTVGLLVLPMKGAPIRGRPALHERLPLQETT